MKILFFSIPSSFSVFSIGFNFSPSPHLQSIENIKTSPNVIIMYERGHQLFLPPTMTDNSQSNKYVVNLFCFFNLSSYILFGIFDSFANKAHFREGVKTKKKIIRKTHESKIKKRERDREWLSIIFFLLLYHQSHRRRCRLP